MGGSLRKGRVLTKYRYALWLSLPVAALIAVVEIAAAPIHANGLGQGVLGYVLGAAHLLNLPGFTAAEVTGLLSRHGWRWGGLALAVLVSGAFWGLTAAICIRIGQRVQGSEFRVQERTGKIVSRRRLLVGGGRAVAAAGM